MVVDLESLKTALMDYASGRTGEFDHKKRTKIRDIVKHNDRHQDYQRELLDYLLGPVIAAHPPTDALQFYFMVTFCTGMTDTDIAKKIDVTPGYVSRIKTNPKTMQHVFNKIGNYDAFGLKELNEDLANTVYRTLEALTPEQSPRTYNKRSTSSNTPTTATASSAIITNAETIQKALKDLADGKDADSLLRRSEEKAWKNIETQKRAARRERFNEGPDTWGKK